MSGYVYILLSYKDNKTYVGSTNDVDRRIEEHSKGIVKSTKNRRPLKLIYKEEFNELAEARLREKYFKTSSGRKKIKYLLKGVV